MYLNQSQYLLQSHASFSCTCCYIRIVYFWFDNIYDGCGSALLLIHIYCTCTPGLRPGYRIQYTEKKFLNIRGFIFFIYTLDLPPSDASGRRPDISASEASPFQKSFCQFFITRALRALELDFVNFSQRLLTVLEPILYRLSW